ncbi:MAG: hypothetical protein ACYSTI_11925 [Planctomycetota bacterium]|jgi:hypothetical protein
MKLSRWILAGLLALAACCPTATIHGVTPISPEHGFPGAADHPTTVETIQPTFRWEPVDERDARYDLIIYESHGVYAAVGREVYYREGLTDPEHTLEVPLQPNREYHWSVRVRRGEEVSEWSRFDYTSVPYRGVTYTEEYPFFWFRTPSK